MISITRAIVKKLASYIEIVLAILLSAVIMVLLFRMVMYGFPHAFAGNMDIEYFLAQALSLAIGVEFVKMLCQHTPETMIEVLMFAIARHMIVEHLSPVETLIGVVSIAGLFAIRKFLFFKFDDDDRFVFRASQRVTVTNALAGVSLPGEGDMTLRDLMLLHLEAEGRKPGIGTVVEFHDCALRIDHIKDDRVTRIELIRPE